MTVETVLQTASRADYVFQNVPIMFVHSPPYLKLISMMPGNSGSRNSRDMEGADGDPALRQQIAKDIRDACVNVGFFYVKNFNISQERVDRQFFIGKEFYDLPLEEKLKYEVKGIGKCR